MNMPEVNGHLQGGGGRLTPFLRPGHQKVAETSSKTKLPIAMRVWIFTGR